MEYKDLDCILKLANKEGWYSDLSEFQLFLKNNPEGCFVLINDEKVIGGIMSFCHSDSAWIGNFIIDAKYRGKGLGTSILTCTLDYLDKQKNIKTIYLNAAQKAIQLYKRFGFMEITPVYRWALCRSTCDNFKKKKKEICFMQ
ncbi:MAG: GNAT family N-acetyltransferase [Methanosarcinales archaeon]